MRQLCILAAVAMAIAAFCAKSAEITFKFNLSTSDGNETTDLSPYVKISYFDLSTFTEPEVEFEDNVGSATFTAGKVMTFTVAPVGSDYVIESVTAAGGGVSISKPSSATGDWNISAPQGGSTREYTFDVVLARTGTHVTLNFVSPTIHSSMVANYVKVQTSAGEYQVNQATGNNIFFTDKVTVAVSGLLTGGEQYEITGLEIAKGATPVSEEELSDYGGSLAVEGGVYTLSLTADADGLTFTFSLAMKETLDEGIDITMKFAGEDLPSPAYELVAVVHDMMKPVNVDSYDFVYTVATGTDFAEFMFIPAEGYVVDVECVAADGEEFGEVIPQETAVAPGAVQLTLSGGESPLPEGLTVLVTVSAASTDGVESIIPDDSEQVDFPEGLRIFTLSGMELRVSTLEGLPGGIYIVNGRKVARP